MPLSPAIEAAISLLGQEPLPADAEQRLKELEKQVPPEEADMFADIWEGFVVANGGIPAKPQS